MEAFDFKKFAQFNLTPLQKYLLERISGF